VRTPFFVGWPKRKPEADKRAAGYPVVGVSAEVLQLGADVVVTEANVVPRKLVRDTRRSSATSDGNTAAPFPAVSTHRDRVCLPLAAYSGILTVSASLS
jgi:hypothetical protein